MHMHDLPPCDSELEKSKQVFIEHFIFNIHTYLTDSYTIILITRNIRTASRGRGPKNIKKGQFRCIRLR